MHARTTYANLMCLIASSSGRDQLWNSGEPYDMHPRMIFETFRPELPRRTIRFCVSTHPRKKPCLLTILHLRRRVLRRSAHYCLLICSHCTPLYMRKCLGSASSSSSEAFGLCRMLTQSLKRTSSYASVGIAAVTTTTNVSVRQSEASKGSQSLTCCSEVRAFVIV